MKQAAILMLTILLSSCWHYYKQLDTNNKPVKTDIIALPDCDIQIYLEKKYRDDKYADYHVILFFTPVNKDSNINPADISVKLFALKSGKEYTPVVIKFRRDLNYDEALALPRPVKAQAVHNGQILSLKAGNRYSLLYSFAGHHQSKLKLNIDGRINSENINKTLVFGRFTEVELLH